MKDVKRKLSAAVLILTALFGGAPLISLTGCHQSPSSSAASSTKQYPIRGTIVRVNTQDGQVTLQHDAIPGLMEAMTMPYPVTDRSALSELHPGDKIIATVLADPSPQGPINLRLSEIVVIAQAKPDYVQAVQYHVPSPGDEVPDFTLLNQSSRKIDLKQYRGKVLLMTFIYTRCPLADYCPRMSRNFAQIDQQLAMDAKLYKDTHLLSVSFDPEYDTPKVLRSYGGSYTGNYTNETFAHWDFAAPSKSDLPAVLRFFDVGATPEKDRTITHSL